MAKSDTDTDKIEQQVIEELRKMPVYASGCEITLSDEMRAFIRVIARCPCSFTLEKKAEYIMYLEGNSGINNGK